jgi:hypothetical protein
MPPNISTRLAVVDAISRLCRAFDERDWKTMRSCLADTLFTDYSSFRGTPPTRLAAEEFVRLRQSGLTGLRTQHLCFNHLVTIEDEGAHAHAHARCLCYFIIHRWPEQANDTRFLHTYGYYHFGLVKATATATATATEERWLIESIEQIAIRSDGTLELHGAHRPVSGTPTRPPTAKNTKTAKEVRAKAAKAAKETQIGNLRKSA